MYYEECTFYEIEAYRMLESESFDFGEGEMRIDGWYGSEDAYYELALEERPNFVQLCLYEKESKHNCKKNKYFKKQIDKQKNFKLYKIGDWWIVRKKKTHFCRCYRKRRSKYLKKISNKMVRNKELSGKNNLYRKYFDFWWNLF